MLFERFYRPTIELTEDVLVRRAGIFYNKRMPLAKVQRVVAVLKDAVTHDNLWVGVLDRDGNEVWFSEFDGGFAQAVSALQEKLPRFESMAELEGSAPFSGASKVLWERNGG
jgi:hypothetical protein